MNNRDAKGQPKKFWEKLCISDMDSNDIRLAYKMILYKYDDKIQNTKQYNFFLAKNLLYYIHDENTIKYHVLGEDKLSIIYHNNNNNDANLSSFGDINRSSNADSNCLNNGHIYLHDFKVQIILENNVKNLTLYAKHNNDINQWLNIIKYHSILQSYKEDLFVIRNFECNHTCSSRIRLVQARKDGLLYCDKIIQITNKQNMQWFGEILLHRELYHSYIVKLDSVYQTDDEIHIITEYLKGGSLQSRLSKMKKLKECQAAYVIKCILEALLYLEKNQIVHRDIKSANIAFCSNREDNFEAKLIDFGLACKVKNLNNDTICGTPGYIAPEILARKPYNCKSDVFGLGIVLYTMLSGTLPFTGKTKKDILNSNFECNIRLDGEEWSKISREGKSLIIQMTKKNPHERISPNDALQSKWIRYHCDITKSTSATSATSAAFTTNNININTNNNAINMRKSTTEDLSTPRSISQASDYSNFKANNNFRKIDSNIISSTTSNAIRSTAHNTIWDIENAEELNEYFTELLKDHIINVESYVFKSNSNDINNH